MSGEDRTEFKNFKEIVTSKYFKYKMVKVIIGKNAAIAVALSLTPSQDAQIDMIKNSSS
jgi:hypothetical protein